MKLIVSLTLCWLMSSACESDFGSKTSGQACTRSSQCAKGLMCLQGLCHSKRKPVQPDVPDAGESDAEAAPEAGELPADIEGE